MNRFVDLMFQGSSGDAPSHWVNNKRALIDGHASTAVSSITGTAFLSVSWEVLL